MKKHWSRYALCDEWYDPNGERAKVHEHPEPQEGFYRRLWMDSKMPYEQWIKDTLNGRAWIEHKNSNKEIKEKVIDINFLQNKVPIKDCLNPKTSHILFSDLIEVWHELNLKKEISFHDLVDAFKDVVRVDYDVMCSHSK